MCSDESCLVFLLGILSTAAGFILASFFNYQLFLVTPSVFCLMNQARFFVVCIDIFLLSAAVLIIISYSFY